MTTIFILTFRPVLLKKQTFGRIPGRASSVVEQKITNGDPSLPVAACVEAFIDEGDEGFDICGDAVFQPMIPTTGGAPTSVYMHRLSV